MKEWNVEEKHKDLKRLNDIVNRIGKERGLAWLDTPWHEISDEEKDAMSDAIAEAFPSTRPEAPRKMDEAPKDGTPVLGWVPTYHRGKGAWVVVLWLEAKGMREAGWMDNQAFLTKPTCWLPLPSAPSPLAQKQEKS